MLLRWPVCHVTEVGSLMEEEWSCYGGGQLNGGWGGRECSCYGGFHFNGRENGHVTEMVFNGGSMVMLQRRSV